MSAVMATQPGAGEALTWQQGAGGVKVIQQGGGETAKA